MQQKTLSVLCLVTATAAGCASGPWPVATQERAASPVVVDRSDEGREGRAIRQTESQRLTNLNDGRLNDERRYGSDTDTNLGRDDFSRFDRGRMERRGGGGGTPQVREENGISYVSGGFGAEEQAALESVSGNFNLQVVFAFREGNYLADLPVRILDRRGNVVLDTVSNGPYLYAALPPGAYTIEARFNGESQRQNVRVGSSGQQRVSFHWEASPANDPAS